MPQHLSSQRTQVFFAFHHRQKVVPGQRSHLAGEATGAVREDDLCFTVPTRVKKNVANGWMAGVIFKAHTKLKVSQRDPASFSAPANVNEFLPIGQ